MVRSPFRSVCLLGLGSLAFLQAVGCARRQTSSVVATPRVDEISPLGLRRGFANLLTFRGSKLSGRPKLVAPFRFTVEDPAPGDSDATFSIRVTVDPATPLGIYPVRLLTDDGLSAPVPLAVGQLPQIQEKEDNGNIDWKVNEADWTAQKIVLPTVVEGELPEKGGDYFRFQGRKGEKIAVDVQCARIGSGLDIDLWLGSRDRDFQADARNAFGGLADTLLNGALPNDDDYLLGLSRSSYRPIKSGRRVYRFTVGALPAAAEVYPLGGRRGDRIQVELRGGTLDDVNVVPVTLVPELGESIVRIKAPTTLPGPDGSPLDVEALPPLLVGDLPEILEPTAPDAPPLKVAIPAVLNGRIDPKDDEDRFLVMAPAGQRIRVTVAAEDLGSTLAPLLTIRDASGKDLANPPKPAVAVAPGVRTPPITSRAGFKVPDRGGVKEYITGDPTVEFTMPDGEVEVSITMTSAPESSSPDGSWRPYRITVVPAIPGFSLALDEAQASVPRGGTTSVKVTASRGGFNGPIAIRLADPPAGLESRDGLIAEGESIGTITLKAATGATFGPMIVDIIGEGQGPSGAIVTRATKVIAYGEPTTEPFRVVVDRLENNESIYSKHPAYLRTRIQTQTGLFVTTSKAAQGR